MTFDNPYLARIFVTRNLYSVDFDQARFKSTYINLENETIYSYEIAIMGNTDFNFLLREQPRG